VGTTNHGTYVTAANARAWSSGIDTIDNYGGLRGLYVHAGMDIEPDWKDSSTTTSWEVAFKNAGSHLIDDFGSADGCPTVYSTTTITCNNGWTVATRGQASYKFAGGNPIPEMYNSTGSQARQWVVMSRYSATTGNGYIYPVGSLTQYQACNDTGNPCSGLKNTAGTGHAQLDTEFRNAGLGLVADFLYTAPDMTWGVSSP
jgi:hypothetical protein